MTKARTTSPLTRNQKKKMSEVPSEVKLRKIVPEVPQDEVERGVLEGGLPLQQRRWRIGGPEGRIYEGLLQRPAKPEERILN
jgi:hypothetical protein